MAQQWWTKEENPHSELVSAFDRIESEDRRRRELDLRHLRMYGGRAIEGLVPGKYYQSSYLSDNQRLTWNVIQSICDSVQAKLAKNKPRAMFLTDGADWSKQNRAKQLSKYVDGLFYREHVYEKGPRALLDALITGTGAVKVGNENGRVVFDRVFTWELFVDPAEALYGEPRNLFHSKYVDRAVLAAMFPKLESKIKLAAGTSGKASEGDMVKVVEAWHLPTGFGDDVGRHVIAIDSATLLDEEYTRPGFPIAFIRWAELPFGFWGQGVAERITGIQVEINTILRDIQERFAIASKVMMLLPRGAKVTKTHVINQNGTMIEYSGDIPPQIVSFQTTQPEIYRHLESLYQRAFDMIGASQLSATSRKPSGLDSGAALRTYNDIETERFVIDGQAYEAFYLELAKLAIEETKALAEDGEDKPLKIIGKRGRRSLVKTIEWKDVELDEDVYEMKAFPVSALPSEPSGRLATVEQWIASGFIGREQGMALLDFPDIDAAAGLETAPYDVILEAAELMIEDGKYMPPEPYQNLELTMKLMQGAYLRAKLDGVPEERLELMREYLATALELLQQQSAPPDAMGAPGPMPPEGMPMGPEMPQLGPPQMPMQ